MLKRAVWLSDCTLLFRECGDLNVLDHGVYKNVFFWFYRVVKYSKFSRRCNIATNANADPQRAPAVAISVATGVARRTSRTSRKAVPEWILRKTDMVLLHLYKYVGVAVTVRA